MKKFLKIATLAFSLAFVALFVSVVVTNQESNEKHRTNLESSEKRDFLSFYDSFDIEADNLGTGFKGHDFVNVGKSLIEKRSLLKLPSKDEFETTKQYSSRVADYKPEIELFGTEDSKHFFAFSPNELQYSAFKYDADNEEFNIHFKTTHYSFKKTLTTNERDGSGTNAFGVTVDVKYTDEVEYELVLHHDKRSAKRHNRMRSLTSKRYDFPYTSITPKWVYYDPSRNLNTQSTLEFSRALKVPLEKAKKIKSTLRVLIITTLQPPYLTDMIYTDEPTLDKPTGGKRHDINIFGQIEQIWLYDSNTGDVIKKWPAESSSQLMCSYDSDDC